MNKYKWPFEYRLSEIGSIDGRLCMLVKIFQIAKANNTIVSVTPDRYPNAKCVEIWEDDNTYITTQASLDRMFQALGAKISDTLSISTDLEFKDLCLTHRLIISPDHSPVATDMYPLWFSKHIYNFPMSYYHDKKCAANDPYKKKLLFNKKLIDSYMGLNIVAREDMILHSEKVTDGFKRKLKVVKKSGYTEQWVRDTKSNNILSYSNSDGYEESRVIDDNGETVSWKNNQGKYLTSSYDDTGMVRTVSGNALFISRASNSSHYECRYEVTRNRKGKITKFTDLSIDSTLTVSYNRNGEVTQINELGSHPVKIKDLKRCRDLLLNIDDLMALKGSGPYMSNDFDTFKPRPVKEEKKRKTKPERTFASKKRNY